MITAQDIHALAAWMVAEHGSKALRLAALAIDELEAKQELREAEHWRALGDVAADMLAGRLCQETMPAIH